MRLLRLITLLTVALYGLIWLVMRLPTPTVSAATDHPLGQPRAVITPGNLDELALLATFSFRPERVIEPSLTFTFSPDSQLLVGTMLAAHYDRLALRWYDLTTGQASDMVHHLSSGGSDRRVTFSHDSRVLAAPAQTRAFGGGVVLWDAATGREARWRVAEPVALPDDPCTGVVLRQQFPIRLLFTPDDRLLAQVRCGTQLIVWNVRTGERLPLPVDVDVYIYAPPGRPPLLDASTHAEITIYEIFSGDPVLRFDIDTSAVRNLVLSHDYTTMVFRRLNETSGDRIEIWDVPSNTQRYSLPLPARRVWDLTLSPGGALLVAASAVPETDSFAVRFWNVASGRYVHSLPVADRIRGVALSPDGTLLAVGVDVGTVELWGVPSHDEATGAGGD